MSSSVPPSRGGRSSAAGYADAASTMGSVADTVRRAKGNPVTTADIDKLANFLTRQIQQRTAKDSDIQRRVASLFGRSAIGITLPVFKHYMHQSFGVKLTGTHARWADAAFIMCGNTEEEARLLFNRYDLEGTGTITLKQFVERVLPPDFPTVPWNIQRDIDDRTVANAKKHEVLDLTLKTMPASLAKNKWTIEKIERAIQRKILERTSRPESQYREAYQLFGNPSGGIPPEQFRRSIENMGIVLTDEELRALVNKYDVDHNGRVDWKEFTKFAMPNDYPMKPWNIQRDEAMEKAREAAAHMPQEPVLDRWPSTLKSVQPTVHSYIEQLRVKILERTKRPSDQYRAAYNLFGCPGHGIRPDEFYRHLRNFGIVISREDSDRVFNTIDDNASGAIDFPELIGHVMGSDYPVENWNIARAKQYDREATESKHRQEERMLSHWPASLKGHEVTWDMVRHQLQQKIVERTKRPSDQYREAYRMFGSPQNGISREELCHKLRAMGIFATDDVIGQLFKHADLNRNGRIEFVELVKRIMPPDYTRTPWYIIRDQQDREKARIAEEKLISESPCGLEKLNALTMSITGTSTARRPATSGGHSLRPAASEVDLSAMVALSPKPVPRDQRFRNRPRAHLNGSSSVPTLPPSPVHK